MTPYVSSYKIFNVCFPGQIFVWVSVSDIASTVSPNDIKIILANGLSTFSVNAKPDFNNDPRILPRNPPSCIILRS